MVYGLATRFGVGRGIRLGRPHVVIGRLALGWDILLLAPVLILRWTARGRSELLLLIPILIPALVEFLGTHFAEGRVIGAKEY